MENNLFPEDVDFSTYDIEEEYKYDETDRDSYYFDFDIGDFLTNPDGTLIKCDEERAYLQWCQKIMLTPRFKKLAYPDYIGTEYAELLTSALSRKAIELEFERMTREALLVHPKTKQVRDFQFDWNKVDGELYVNYTVVDDKNYKHNIHSKIKR